MSKECQSVNIFPRNVLNAFILRCSFSPGTSRKSLDSVLIALWFIRSTIWTLPTLWLRGTKWEFSCSTSIWSILSESARVASLVIRSPLQKLLAWMKSSLLLSLLHLCVCRLAEASALQLWHWHHTAWCCQVKVIAAVCFFFRAGSWQMGPHWAVGGSVRNHIFSTVILYSPTYAFYPNPQKWYRKLSFTWHLSSVEFSPQKMQQNSSEGLLGLSVASKRN